MPRILFVETAPGIGGSVTNVLYPLTTGLDRTRYALKVLFYEPNPYRARLEAAGVATQVLDNPVGKDHPPLIAAWQAKHPALFEALRRDRGFLRQLYHGLGSYFRVGSVLPTIFRLSGLIRSCGADLVHLNRDHASTGRVVILAAKLAGARVLCYAQNFSEFQHVDRQIARWVDVYVFCSEAIGRHCIAFGGVAPQRQVTRTIYPGVAMPEVWLRNYAVREVRRSLGWSETDFVVGNIGRLVPWKGQEVFLHALAEARRMMPQLKGLIVGGEDRDSPGYGDSLKTLAYALGLDANVYFAGFREDIPALMASLDVLVHSSIEPEPFATTVIEGMLAARPIVAMEAGGMPEMIVHRETGLLVPPRDPQAMAQAIRFYAEDRERAEQMGQAARRAALSRLTTQQHIQAIEGLYEMLFARWNWQRN
jgi:glycosyltransferase involved in cell wall biosynthesis